MLVMQGFHTIYTPRKWPDPWESVDMMSQKIKEVIKNNE